MTHIAATRYNTIQTCPVHPTYMGSKVFSQVIVMGILPGVYNKLQSCTDQGCLIPGMSGSVLRSCAYSVKTLLWKVPQQPTMCNLRAKMESELKALFVTTLVKAMLTLNADSSSCGRVSSHCAIKLRSLSTITSRMLVQARIRSPLVPLYSEANG